MSDFNLYIDDLLVLSRVQPDWRGERPLFFTGVSIDTRSLTEGALYFALKGDRFDGHDYVEEAFKKGAAACVVKRSWHLAQKTPPSGPVCIVDDVLWMLQEVALVYRQKFDIPVIALTGSSGKTTTKEMVVSVLRQGFQVHCNRKSFNNHIGVPITLLGIRPHHDVVVCEVGTNHFGELDRLSYLVRPTICILINIGHAHLEAFQDLEGVARAKMEIFSHADPGGHAIYNADDDVLSRQTFPVRRTTTFGSHVAADVRGEVLGLDGQARYRLRLGQTEIGLAVPGRHNVDNALAAAATGRVFSLSDEQIRTGLEQLQSVENRMHLVKWEQQDIVVINDTYNSNPNSCRAGLATLADLSPDDTNRRIAVLADMLELGHMSRPEHEALADVALANRIDVLYLFGNETRFTASRAKQLGLRVAMQTTDKERLHQVLLDELSDGDRILVKGSRGMKMETVVEAITRVLDHDRPAGRQ